MILSKRIFRFIKKHIVKNAIRNRKLKREISSLKRSITCQWENIRTNTKNIKHLKEIINKNIEVYNNNLNDFDQHISKNLRSFDVKINELEQLETILKTNNLKMYNTTKELQDRQYKFERHILNKIEINTNK